MRLTQKQKEDGVNLWKLWKQTTFGFLTCLNDRWFWRDFRDSIKDLGCRLFIFLGKVLCTLLAPIPGLAVAIRTRKENLEYLDRWDPQNENNKD